LFFIWGLSYSCALAASDSGTLSPFDQPPAREAPASAGPPVAGAAFQERLLLVDINGQQLNETVLVLEDKKGTLYLWGRDLQRWRLRLPDTRTGVDHRGESYYPLSAMAGVSHVLDPKRLTLMIEAPPEAFAETTRTARYAPIPPPVAPGPGGFLNYDLFAAHSPDSTQRLGQFELGYFNRAGIGTASVLAENLGSHPRVTRLDTTWTVDYPEKLQSLRLGDAVNRPGTWGRSVRFGGIQYGTNFATQPGFVAFPLQSAAGQAVLPSTVDVFVNNALVARQSVPPGPFSIGNLPVVTGAGEVRLVVRDLFGREQLITQPFYASQALLREGLEDFSYELGLVRENFGLNSNDYGSWLGTGTYRRGLSERFTGEVHAEGLRDQATVGVGGDYLMPQVGTLSSYVATSHGRSRNGALLLLGIDRQARPWSLGARTQWTTRDFTQIGLLPGQLAPVRLSTFSLSHTAGAGGSIGFAYVLQHNRSQADARVATLSYSVFLGRIGSFSISAVRNLVGDVNTTVFALLSIPLNRSTTASFNPRFVRGGSAGSSHDFTATLQRHLPLGEGYGYRLLSRSNGAKEASYSLQNNFGLYTVEAAHALGTTATRVSAAGGVAVLGGDAFLSRRIDQSFAVARIPDYPDVRILADNQLAGRTDSNGNALIPRLRAYDRNVISVDQRDVPLDAEIRALKIETVPYFRSGVDVTFPIKRSRGATFTIRLEDGKPLPVGASVRIVGKDETYAVGYDGEVYVVGLDPANRLRATWRGQSCEFELRFTASTDPLPDLGTFICKGVKP
jgi:outer membrane usher protein